MQEYAVAYKEGAARRSKYFDSLVLAVASMEQLEADSRYNSVRVLAWTSDDNGIFDWYEII